MPDPDWSDPCAVLIWLRPHYYKVAAGVQEIRITYKGRDTQYGQANLQQLGMLMQQLEADCARKNGTAVGRRRAIRFG